MLDPNSRYFDLADLHLTGPDGEVVVYKARRFIPRPDAFQVVGQVQVTHQDRPDLLAARTLGDPLAFYHLCDANGALHPMDLVARDGAQLRVPMPMGGESEV